MKNKFLKKLSNKVMLIFLFEEILLMVCEYLSTRDVLNIIQCAKHFVFCRKLLCNKSNPLFHSCKYIKFSEINLMRKTRTISTNTAIKCNVTDLDKLNIVQGRILLPVIQLNDENSNILHRFLHGSGSRKIVLRLSTGVFNNISIIYCIVDRKISYSLRHPYLSSIGLRTKPFLKKICGPNINSIYTLIKHNHHKIKILPISTCAISFTMYMSKKINFNRRTLSSFAMATKMCFMYLNIKQKYNERILDNHDFDFTDKFIQYKLNQFKSFGRLLDECSYVKHSQTIYNSLIYEMMGIKYHMINLYDPNKNIYKKELFELPTTSEYVINFCISMNSNIKDNITDKDFNDCKRLYNEIVNNF